MGGGPFLLLLLFPIQISPSAQHFPDPKQANKYYQIFEVPAMRWEEDAKSSAYKHEIVLEGGLNVKIRPGSNYSVYPTRDCGGKRVAFVIQVSPIETGLDSITTQVQTCTIAITIDDGHVEIWYGLCLAKEPHYRRKFDFALNPMNVVYFTFERLTMILYKRESDFGSAFEMGRVEHVSLFANYSEFKQFTAFTYKDSCPEINLKQVFAEDDWRRTKEEVEEESEVAGNKIFWRMVAIFLSFKSVACLILATMYVWSMSVPFFTNPIYDFCLAGSAKNSAIQQQQEEDANSCKTAEDASEDGMRAVKEDLFGDKGKNKPPMRAPHGYALRDFDAPYADDEEGPDMRTAIDLEIPSGHGSTERRSGTASAMSRPSKTSSKYTQLKPEPAKKSPVSVQRIFV